MCLNLRIGASPGTLIEKDSVDWRVKRIAAGRREKKGYICARKVETTN